MEKFKNKFDALYEKYSAKKSSFLACIQRWENKGWQEAHLKGKLLLNELEALAQELKQNFALAGTASALHEKTVKEKVKRFKNLYKELYESTKPLWRQWLEAIVIALTLAFILRHTVFSPYHVPTGSAEPNILVGDRIWGNKMAYYLSDIKRGDLVIFDDPRPGVYDRSSSLQRLWQRYVGIPIPFLGLKAGPMNVVKRVIAIPGDTIEGKIEEGKTVLYLNGKKLDEPYVNKFPLIHVNKTTGFFPFDGFGPFKIPDFLVRKTTKIRYTYDPSLPLDQQPYYYVRPDEVILDQDTSKPVLDLAFVPQYSLRIGEREIYSVDTFGPLILPQDMYYVMGDSRQNSEDSRYWGPLHKNYIRGRASFVLFSLDSEEVFWLFDFIKHPIDFWTKHVRWTRFLKRLDGFNGKVAK